MISREAVSVIIDEAIERIVDFFSSSIPTVEEKKQYLLDTADDYSSHPSSMIGVLQLEMSNRHNELYRSVWPITVYR